MKNLTGFSLIELLITMAIAAIILVIAVPSYQNTVQKSRRSDATGALSEAVAMQDRIYTETNSYVANADLSRLVVNSDGVSSREGYYTLAVNNDACAGPPFRCFSITATAVGPQANDTDCATFTINHIGQKTSAPTSNCW